MANNNKFNNIKIKGIHDFAEDLKDFQELYKIIADKIHLMLYKLGF